MILEKIQHELDNLSSAQRRIAQYILEHCAEVVLMTALQLGENAGASEATVIRLANALGYQGYPELKAALGEVMQDRLSAAERLKSHLEGPSTGNLVENVLRQDLDKGMEALTSLDDLSMRKAARALCEAPAVYVMAMRSARALSIYLRAYLSWFRPLVQELSVDSFIEPLALAPQDSLIVGISFPRYTRETVEHLRLAHKLGFRTLAITDSAESPLAEYADITLTAPCSHMAFIDSLVLPMSLLNALILQVAEDLGASAQQKLVNLEKDWAAARTYC